MENPIKMDDLGVPLLSETSISPPQVSPGGGWAQRQVVADLVWSYGHVGQSWWDAGDDHYPFRGGTGWLMSMVVTESTFLVDLISNQEAWDGFVDLSETQRSIWCFCFYFFSVELKVFFWWLIWCVFCLLASGCFRSCWSWRCLGEMFETMRGEMASNSRTCTVLEKCPKMWWFLVPWDDWDDGNASEAKNEVTKRWD